MPEVDVSRMSPEEGAEFAANAIMNMSIGKIAVGVFEKDGTEFIQLFQRTNESNLEVLTMKREAALELHSALGRMLNYRGQNN